MTFREWLGQIGLAHCGQALLENGIDFDVAQGLTESDLRSLGLNLGDSRRFLQALNRLGQTTAERRQLSVMFCDLVGSTELAHRLDPEELDHVIRAYRGACTKVVAHYDGYAAQYLGDGLMVYFGWPNAHEDDTERCVRSALDIVQAVKEVKCGGFTEAIAVRIGVATGPVVVGETSRDGNGAQGLAVGETPNLAARLQGLAGADEIVIGPTTRQLVGNTFELDDLGVHALKGIVQPVRAWRVHAVRRTEGRFDAAHGGTPLSRLVGRANEVADLERDWQLTRHGAGRAVLIEGEAGIGKSRLTEVLRHKVEGELHATILRYQCSPFHLNAALYPVMAQIEIAAGFAREDTLEQKLDKLERILVGRDVERAESAQLFAALLSLSTDRYPPLGLSPQKQKEKTLEALAGQVAALSKQKPVLMVVEDVHWIDPTSQELLDVLAPQLKTLPVMLMLTYRPQQYSPRWPESGHVRTMTLTGLAQEQSAELAHNVASGKALPAEVLEELISRADGVPLFLEELTKSVLESGLLHEEADRYTLLEPLQALTIPSTLNALLIARLDRRKGVRELAQIGACIGRVFSYELLAAVSATNGQEFDAELEQLTATGLVFRRGTPPDATYAFKHALVQDAAYGSLLKSTRQQLHAQIADALEKKFPQSVANQPELLAHHRTEAGQLETAIPLWRRAGESAFARVALQEAVAYLEKGVAIVDRLPPSADRDCLELSVREPLHSARLRWRGWAAPQVRANATATLELGQKQRRPQSLLIGLWGMWVNTLTQGRAAESLEWARRLVAEASQSGDFDLKIFGHRALGFSDFYLGELAQALEQRDRIVPLYDPRQAERWMELTGNDVMTAVGIFASQALWMLGYPDQAAHLSDQKDAHSRRLGQPFDLGWALTWGAYVFDYRCELDRLRALVDEADRLGREQTGPGRQRIPVLSKVLVPMVKGLALLRSGELPEAISSLQTFIDGWETTGGHLNIPYVKAALAEAVARQGDVDSGLRLIEEGLEQIERPGWQERVWLPEILRLKGRLLVHRGRPEEAETALRASIDCARQQHAKSWELRSSTTLAELLLERGDREAARELLAPVYGWFSEGFETHDLKAARSLLEDLH